MIDFENSDFLKLRRVDNDDFDKKIGAFLTDGEYTISAFKTVRDGVVFTNKRIIAINKQGVTGKKTDYSSLPYKKVQLFSIETAGHIDLDSELVLYFSGGVGTIRFEFLGNANVEEIAKTISHYVL